MKETNKGKKKKAIKKIIIGIIAIICVPIIMFCGYAIYVFAGYYRIEDNIENQIENNQEKVLKLNTQYTALTFNIGFGAYDSGFDFFLDDGYDENGKVISGKHGKAVSRANTINNTSGAIETASKQSTDFILFQEVDVSANRSYFYDQKQNICASFESYSSVFSENLHLPYVAIPLTDPIGGGTSGLLTLAKYKAISSLRRSLPLSSSIFDNLFDLDRCISITRYEINGSESEFVLINVHLSAYDKDGGAKAKQVEFLSNILSKEKEANNYVVVGGDFNHVIAGDKGTFIRENGEITPPWVMEWTASFDGYSLVSTTSGDDDKNIGTCRNNTRSYNEKWTYTCVLDGFIVSDNVAVKGITNITSHNFKYSDHNPVKLSFALKN